MVEIRRLLLRGPFCVKQRRQSCSRHQLRTRPSSKLVSLNDYYGLQEGTAGEPGVNKLSQPRYSRAGHYTRL